MAALAADPEAASQFMGTVIGTVPADTFVAPENLARIMSAGDAEWLTEAADPVPRGQTGGRDCRADGAAKGQSGQELAASTAAIAARDWGRGDGCGGA